MLPWETPEKVPMTFFSGSTDRECAPRRGRGAAPEPARAHFRSSRAEPDGRTKNTPEGRGPTGRPDLGFSPPPVVAPWRSHRRVASLPLLDEPRRVTAGVRSGPGPQSPGLSGSSSTWRSSRLRVPPDGLTGQRGPRSRLVGGSSRSERPGPEGRSSPAASDAETASPPNHKPGPPS